MQLTNNAQESPKVVPIGGMDTDLDPNIKPDSDTQENFNVRSITTNGGTTVSWEPIQGNKLAVALPFIDAQDKIYKITIVKGIQYAGSITLEGDDIIGVSYIIDVGSGLSYTQIKGFIVSAFTGNTYVHLSNTSADDDEIFIEILGHKDYIIEVGLPMIAEVTQEARTITGYLEPIGSFDMNGDLYIFSCLGSTPGLGEIGVMTHNANQRTFTYTSLLTSTEFNFSTQYPIDVDGERGDSDRLYFGDFNNPDRVFYYKGAFTSQGALKVNNPDNIYVLGKIDEGLRMQQASLYTSIDFAHQYQSGGKLQSGNWRYSAKLLTAQLAETPVLPLTHPVPVFNSDINGDATLIKGDKAGTETSKVNELTINNIDPSLYRYIDLICINYAGQVPTGFVKRLDITGTSMVVTHSGAETNLQDFDVTGFAQDFEMISTSKHRRIIDSRLVRANLKIAPQGNFQTIASAITMTTVSQAITGSGNMAGFKVGEFQDPQNYKYLGYAIGERIAFGIRYKNRDATYSRVFPIGIHTITPTNNNLTNDSYTTTQVLTYGVEFNNIDISSIKNDILGFEIVRAEVEQEILVTGILILTEDVSNGGVGSFQPTDNFTRDTPTFNSKQYANRKLGVLYCPDILTGASSISWRAGDRIKVLGAAHRINSPFRAHKDTNIDSAMPEFSGYFSNATFTSYALDDAKQIGFRGSSILNNTAMGASEITLAVGFEAALGISCSTNITSNTPYDDYGVYYAQYYRPATNKYLPSPGLSYVTTGHAFDTSTTAAVIINHQTVFGGNVFTQPSYLKIQYPQTQGSAGNGIAFFSQNKVNFKLRYNIDGGSDYLFPASVPGANIAERFAIWMETNNRQSLSYDQGYNALIRVQIFSPYDPNAVYATAYPARIQYSELKPQNATQDNYRAFLPLNFRDEGFEEGEITGLEVLNGELYTWQNRAFKKQFFNTRGLIKSDTTTDIILGNGSVLAQKSQKISAFGTKHKWSIIKGRSMSGDDTAYWVNTEYKKVIRFAGDGVTSISDTGKMSSFFANNLEWADLFFTPTYNGGIHGVWDERYKEAVFTFRAKRTVNAWSTFGLYAPGDLVEYNTPYFDFHETGEIYISKTNNGASTPNNHPDDWTRIPHFDYDPLNPVKAKDYFNEYTISFSELKTRFTSFYSFKPKLYLRWKDTYLSGFPTASEKQKIFLHNTGTDYLQWYSTGDVGLEEDGWIDLILNPMSQYPKMHLGIKYFVANMPYYVELFTARHRSFLQRTDNDFRERFNEVWTSTVKMDILTSPDGTNLTDGKRMTGTWMRVRFYYKIGEYQKLFGILCNMFLMGRLS